MVGAPRISRPRCSSARAIISMRFRPRWCAGTPRVGRRGALKSPEPPQTYGAQSWLERPNPVGRRVADARWAGRDAHLTAARPIVREFVFLRLPKRSRRARLHDRVRENGHPVEGVGGNSQAEKPDPHGPLQAPKIFPPVWQVRCRLAATPTSCAPRFSYGAQSQKTGLEKGGKNPQATSPPRKGGGTTRRAAGEFPPRIAPGNLEEVP